MAENTLSVLKITPGQYPQQVEIDNDLKALQQAVGGTIAAVYPFADPVAIICNDEGKLIGLPLNRALRDENGEMYDALMKNKIIGVCPNCGANVVEREKGWFCENRECRFVLWKDNAFFKRLGKRLDAHVADKLLRDGRVRLKDCKSAKGKTYNATVLLSCEADGRSKFSLEFENGGC